MQVGSIEAAKDTREIIKGTIGVHLNNGLKRIVDKMLVVHLLEGVNDSCEVTLAEEPPALQNNNTFLSFSIRSFITGDLAFFATILGKEHKKNIERKQKQELGKNDRAVLQSVERVLRAHSIEKPYCHGGLYNGKAMNRLMTCSQTLMHDIQNVLLDAPVHATRCSDDEIISWAEKFANILKVFDEVFSISRTPSGQLTGEQGRILMLRVEESLRLWRGLSLNVTPKVHAVEDHLCQQVCRLNGIGDLGEDFLEQSHQEGIKDHARSKNAKRERAANLHSNWEEQHLYPDVRDKMDADKIDNLSYTKNK